MPLLRLNEHYTSVQGEGPSVGKLTQFVRFSGCNMRCPGWPCDTQHAIIPTLWKDDPKLDVDMLIRAVQAEAASTGAMHICLTGGEPFMQDTMKLGQVVKHLLNLGYTFDIFTNGSFEFPFWTTQRDVHLIMDWKLRGSGEAETALEMRQQNLSNLFVKDAIKFVVKDEDDWDEACLLTDEFHIRCPIYVGRVWDAALSDADLVALIKRDQADFRLNVQVHKLIYPGIERGI